MVMTDEDYRAIRKKLDNKDEIVLCPRCGNELLYEERGNSVAVDCKTPNCIHGGIRGL
jgi:DNA-directed RNA polymerase subunit RPC12/RpoP